MTKAGDLNRRVAFDAVVRVSDGHGGTKTGWSAPENAVTVWAKFRYLRGGETVQAARLAGRQPIVVTVRNSSQVGQIATEWRMRGPKTGEIYNIRSGPVPTDDRKFLEFTVEGGVAT